jgi:hypothetical protein
MRRPLPDADFALGKYIDVAAKVKVRGLVAGADH